MPSYRRLFQKNDPTDQQWRVLRALWEKQHLTSAPISQITLLPPPSLVGILDRLKKKNLIGCLRSTEDHRHVNIIPTQKGRAFMEHMMPTADRFRADLPRRVTAAEWAELNPILDKLSELEGK